MFILTSCQRNGQTSSTAKVLPAQSLLNVAYGKDSLQRMDIYLPEGRTTTATKALILIHGGGWNSGSKSDFASYIDTFKKRLPDYAIFNINYRLVNGGHFFPAQETDVRAALDFIASKANDYHFNKNQLALMGVSAGAHLALLQAYKYAQPRVKAVIDYFGPTDLMAMHQKPWHPLVPMALQMITGTTPEVNPDIFKQSSPVHFITSRSAPTLILHGARDNVVDISQSKILQQKLEKAGVQHELVIYPHERHGWWSAKAYSNSFDRIEKFLRAHVN